MPIIKWKVLRKCLAYNQKKRQCILCLNEKYEIACYKGENLFNKRTGILGTCRHRNKSKLKNCDSSGKTKSNCNSVVHLKADFFEKFI